MTKEEFETIKVCSCYELRKVFANKASWLELFNVVDEPGHWAFKVRFVAYGTFPIVFNYDLDAIGVSIETPSRMISLVPGNHYYSSTNLDDYLAKAMAELELRLPDKYLKAHHWL